MEYSFLVNIGRGTGVVHLCTGTKAVTKAGTPRPSIGGVFTAVAHYCVGSAVPVSALFVSACNGNTGGVVSNDHVGHTFGGFAGNAVRQGQFVILVVAIGNRRPTDTVHFILVVLATIFTTPMSTGRPVRGLDTGQGCGVVDRGIARELVRGFEVFCKVVLGLYLLFAFGKNEGASRQYHGKCQYERQNLLGCFFHQRFLLFSDYEDTYTHSYLIL